MNLHVIDLPHSRGYRRVDGVEYPRHRADTVTVTASMAWGVRNLISTLSSTGSDRHSPRATGGALLRVACMPSRWRRLFFAAAPMDLPRRPICLWLPLCLFWLCSLLARPAPSDGKPSATAAPVFNALKLASPRWHTESMRLLVSLHDASSKLNRVRAFSAVLARLAA